MSKEFKMSQDARPPYVLAALLLLIGAVIGVGGIKLALLGGSLYYIAGAVLVAGSGVLLIRKDARGPWLYVLFLAVTLIWAIMEAGLDAWALTARLFAPAVLGLWFFLPGLRRGMVGAPGLFRFGAHAAGGLAVISLGAILLVALLPGKPAAAFPEPVQGVPVSGAGAEWSEYGGTPGGTRFSLLTKLTPENVGGLKPAWEYHWSLGNTKVEVPSQATPLMIGDTLYFCSATNIVVALDAESGAERWRFDPKVDATGRSPYATCRGVAFHRAQSAECPERIIAATFDARLFALDAHTGHLCPSFGQGGFVNLKKGMGQVIPGFYYPSSAPTILRGKVVIGGWVSDNQSIDEPSGVIRAFDAVTGAFVWAWDMGRPGNSKEPGPGETYTRSTPNSWAPMSVDDALGLVFVPLGNPTPDYSGQNRRDFDEKYGSSIVALDIETGMPRWSFQTAHHDVWDYDVPAQPTLVNIPHGGEIVPALVQATKRGELFVLDRRTGVPIAAVEEKPVPQTGGAPGGYLSPTQPFSVGMPSFSGGVLKESDMWGLTPLDQLWCRIDFRRVRYDGPLTPPGLTRSLIYPSIGGGMNWGGISVDPEHAVAIVNSLNIGTTVQLVPRAETDRILALVKANGEGQGDTTHSSSDKFVDAPLPQLGAPYGAIVHGLFSPLEIPCNKPPHGTLSAVDLRTGTLLWRHPVGTARDSGPFGIATGLPLPVGMAGFGGTLTTKGGLAFMGAVREKTFRAFDIRTGRELWSARLPAGGQSTPMTYISPKSGRQFVVIMAGGSTFLKMPLSDAVVAFALPNKPDAGQGQ